MSRGTVSLGLFIRSLKYQAKMLTDKKSSIISTIQRIAEAKRPTRRQMDELEEVANILHDAQTLIEGILAQSDECDDLCLVHKHTCDGNCRHADHKNACMRRRR